MDSSINKQNPPWADLPVDLLTTIAEFLTSNHLDIISFRAVCNSWLSSSLACYSPSPHNLTHFLPFAGPRIPSLFDWDGMGRPCHGEYRGTNTVISTTIIFAINKTWMLFADQFTPGKIMVRKPFSQVTYSRPLNFPEGLDVPNVPLREVGRFHNVSCTADVTKPPCLWSEYVRKVVLFSDNLVAVALFRVGLLCYYRFEGVWNMTAGWQKVGGNRVRVDDIINFKDTILYVNNHAGLFSIPQLRTSPLGSAKCVAYVLDSGTKRRKRLVESLGCLYLVIKTIDRDVKFVVYELEEDACKWVEVTSLSDRIFFFGIDFSFSVSTEEVGGSFGSNCIVYMKGSFHNYGHGNEEDEEEEDGNDHNLFSNLGRNDLRIGVWHMDKPGHIGVIGSYPGCSDVLWPPPAWIWRKDMSKRLEDLGTAIDGLFVSIADEYLKAISREQAEDLPGGVTLQHISELQRLAHELKTCLNEGREIDRNMKNMKENAVSEQQLCKSIIPNHQAGSCTRGTEESRKVGNFLQRPAEEPVSSDDNWQTSKRKLHAILLDIEESTSKLQDIVKSYQLPCADSVV